MTRLTQDQSDLLVRTVAPELRKAMQRQRWDISQWFSSLPSSMLAAHSVVHGIANGRAGDPDAVQSGALWRQLTDAERPAVVQLLLNAIPSYHGWIVHFEAGLITQACFSGMDLSNVPPPTWPINARDEQWGDTVLHAAACRCSTKIIDHLLTHGADPRAKSRDGNTVLHAFASATGPIWGDRVERAKTIVNALVARGASIDEPNAQSQTPLQVAIENGRHDVGQALAEAGADIRRVDFNLIGNASEIRAIIEGAAFQNAIPNIKKGRRAPARL